MVTIRSICTIVYVFLFIRGYINFVRNLKCNQNEINLVCKKDQTFYFAYNKAKRFANSRATNL